MSKRHKAIEGMDYVPVPGSDPNIVFGVVRSTLGGKANTATGAILGRLYPIKLATCDDAPTLNPQCYRFDVTLPNWAPSDYVNPLVAARDYDDLAWDGMKDLVIMINFRFPQAIRTPPEISLPAAWELVRGFAYQRLTCDRDLVVVLAMHVPTLAGRPGAPHIHTMAFARRCGPTGFGEFVRPLATDAGREIIETEFAEWRAERLGG
jgi:hypothetical protein